MKILRIDKTKLNLVIDIIMLILIMPVAGLGFLMKYILVSGIKRNEIYGTDVDLKFLGLDRHEWGSIHLILSLTLLGFLVLHIVFHWKMIICMFKRLLPVRSFRLTWVIFMIALSLILISFPLFVIPDKVPRESVRRNRQFSSRGTDQDKDLFLNDEIPDTQEKNEIQQRDEIRQNRATRQAESTEETVDHPKRQAIESEPEHHHQEYIEFEVFGYETMQSVADKYDVPVSVIAEDLNIPLTLADRKLGWLRRQYNFTMTDVRKSIYDYKKK